MMKPIVRSLLTLWITTLLWYLVPLAAKADCEPIAYPLTLPEHFGTYEKLHVFAELSQFQGRSAVQVERAPGLKGDDRNTLVYIPGFDFHNGTIEVQVASTLVPNPPPVAKGFVGIAFRVQPQGEHFEALYLRPVNARAKDQLNRNHSLQYFSFPDYPFSRLRAEAPGQYEAYTDLALGQWTSLKIVVKDSQAQLYINGAEQPSLVVNDLKLGSDLRGTIGLWADTGTRAYFSNLIVTPAD